MEIEDHDPTSNASLREEESLIRVVIKTLSGHNFNVEIDRNIYIRDFKEIVEQLAQIPVAKQRLIYQGRALKDELSIKDYKIQNEQVIHLVEKVPPSSTQERSETTGSSSQVSGSSYTNAPNTQSTTPFLSNRIVFSTRIPGHIPDSVSPSLSNVQETNYGYNTQTPPREDNNNSFHVHVQNSLSTAMNPSNPVHISTRLLSDIERVLEGMERDAGFEVPSEEAPDSSVTQPLLESTPPEDSQSTHPEDSQSTHPEDSQPSNDNASTGESSDENTRSSESRLNETEQALMVRISKIMSRIQRFMASPSNLRVRFIPLLQQFSVALNVCTSFIMTSHYSSRVRISVSGESNSNVNTQEEGSQENSSTDSNPQQGVFNMISNPFALLLQNAMNNNRNGDNSNSDNSQPRGPRIVPIGIQVITRPSQMRSNPTTPQSSSQNSPQTTRRSHNNAPRSNDPIENVVAQEVPEDHPKEYDTSPEKPKNKKRHTLDYRDMDDDEIHRIIDEDEEIQRNLPSQRPFSDSYQDASKKRKLQPVEEPSTLMSSILRKCIRNVHVKPKYPTSDEEATNEEIVNLAKYISPLYVTQIKEGVSEQIEENEDFENVKDRFPNLSKFHLCNKERKK